MSNKYSVSEYIKTYSLNEIYLSDKKLFSDIYSDQVDNYDGLVNDIKKLFISNTNSGYNNFGCDIIRFYRGNGVSSDIYRNFVNNNDLISYLSKHETGLFLSLSFDLIKDCKVKLSDFHISLLYRLKDILLSRKDNSDLLYLGSVISCLNGDMEIVNNLEYIFQEYNKKMYEKYNSTRYNVDISDFKKALQINYSKNERLILEEFEKITREKGYQDERRDFIEALIESSSINKNLSKYFSKKLTKVKMKELFDFIGNKIGSLLFFNNDDDSLLYIRRLTANMIKESDTFLASSYWTLLDKDSLLLCLPIVLKNLNDWERKKINKFLYEQ